MSFRRVFHSAVVLNNSIFIAGGNIYSNQYKYGVLPEVDEYNVLTGDMTRIAPMSIAREMFGMAAVKNKVCVIGGHSGYSSLSDMECYSTLTKKWSDMPSMAVERRAHAVATLDEEIYAIAGYTEGIDRLDSCERFSFKTNQWSPIASLYMHRDHAAAASLGVCAIIAYCIL